VFFVEKGDVEGMARAILNLVSTKNEDLGKIARDYVLKFDLTNVALEEYEIIQSVLCRKSDR
jgi:glycosyltransferase involved in cell wall biosynthesis